ncbi:carboxypeptidase-like regulatory domain-containing protein [Carboxylicivirga litoralis]|uniref:carboxypeptidase-like regulatory domain-containing protein n=1 Tax=Carboxylicivirga litoralis TaxID=2816963 RepID=UPI0021CB3791|nr:carboxypeptidase-like regulatory domain-containing protein [Carboxylicivirga sp. A043]
MSGQEANAFERQLLNDSFEADALEGLSMLETSTIDADLKRLKSKINQPTVFWRRPAFYAAASIILLVGILSSLWLLVPDDAILVSDNQLKTTKKELIVDKKEASTQTVNKPTEERRSRQAKAEPLNPKTQKATPKQGQETAKKAAPQATKLQATSDFEMSDLEEFNIKAPQSDSPVSRIEEEVMTVDYGTLEGKSFEAQSGAEDDELKIVKGKVVDRNREPLPGATINVRGTQIATVANMDGTYQIKVPVKDTSKPLDAFYVGFVAQESNYPKADSVNFVLQEDYMALSEVVTIESDEEQERRIKEFINAEPIGGLDQYIEDIEASLRYPKNSSGKKEQVIALVTISLRGDIKNIELKRSPGEAYSVETIRAIRNGARWKPASKKGFPVDDTVKIKLRFAPKRK